MRAESFSAADLVGNTSPRPSAAAELSPRDERGFLMRGHESDWLTTSPPQVFNTKMSDREPSRYKAVSWGLPPTPAISSSFDFILATMKINTETSRKVSSLDGALSAPLPMGIGQPHALAAAMASLSILLLYLAVIFGWACPNVA